MNQNDDVSYLSSASLAGMNIVIEDESEYVFVAEDEEASDDEFEEWDNCDVSPSLSCASSVATNVTLKDLNLNFVEDSAMDVDDQEREKADSGAEDAAEPSDDAMEMEVEEVEDSKRMKASEEVLVNTGDENIAGIATKLSSSDEDITRKVFANPKNGLRLSNKKLRRRVQMLKKAAAARAAAEAHAEERAASGATWAAVAAKLSSSEESASTAGSDLPPERTNNVKDEAANLAVSCDQVILAAYSDEDEANKVQRKTRAVSIDVQ